MIRSNRKTIAIYIAKGGTVEVRAPQRATKASIDGFVLAKQDWIHKQLAARQQQIKQKAAFVLYYGDTVSLRGKNYSIEARRGNRAGFDGERFFLPPGLPPEEIKRNLIQVYRLIAKDVLATKVAYYAKLVGSTPIAVKINGAKGRWGSCSSKNSINFSWRLMMADDPTIDYVVVHELAHIREHNHSSRFWAIVASVLPDYEVRRAALKELQKRLAIEDWE
ncbi:MAG: M48 family metallopeptidase [Clostridia bacterium]|nr:M48 family metallopeptidase [Clostridia bacterium]